MSSITIKQTDITLLHVDVIVNAANEQLMQGGGVCGAIFRAAGADELARECREIGHCPTGSAVMTHAFVLPALRIIHAVGPIWRGGGNLEAKYLYMAYERSLMLAVRGKYHSIAFPLISAGIYGYPKDQAWEIALRACIDFLKAEAGYEMDIIFAVIDDENYAMGQAYLEAMTQG